MTKPILEVKDLDVFFGTGAAQITAVRGASFSINPAETVALVGESGSGKSTFLKCLSGLEIPNSGVISLNGQIINGDNIFVKPQNRKIGYVFQDYPLIPHLNVKENICFNLKFVFFQFDFGNGV